MLRLAGHDPRHGRSWVAGLRPCRTDPLETHLDRGFPLIGTIIKICPLLGLLGTVAGMLEVFDALAATGANNPRSMAAGVSKATVSTLAGMVVAIFGLLGSKFIERRALTEREALPAKLVYTGAGDDA